VRQLAGSDAIFLSLETATTQAHIGAVMVLEPVSAANATVSNVPGPPIPLYLAGGRIEATYPVSIILPGIGLNVTVVSYLDRVDFGFTVDPDLVPDPWYLSLGIPLALEELKEAIGIDHATPLRSTRNQEDSIA